MKGLHHRGATSTPWLRHRRCNLLPGAFTPARGHSSPSSTPGTGATPIQYPENGTSRLGALGTWRGWWLSSRGVGKEREQVVAAGGSIEAALPQDDGHCSGDQ